jgi:uncharacterized membrane protein
MHQHSFMPRHVALALVAGLSSFAATTARADIKICNDYSESIRVALTIPDSDCHTSGFSQHAWYVLTPGECQIPFGESAAGLVVYSYALAFNGTYWPASGDANTFAEDFGAFDTPFVTCYEAMPLQCRSSPPQGCHDVAHYMDDLRGSQSTRLAISFSE